MFRAMKMYNPGFGGNGMEKVVGILGLFFVISNYGNEWNAICK